MRGLNSLLICSNQFSLRHNLRKNNKSIKTVGQERREGEREEGKERARKGGMEGRRKEGKKEWKEERGE